MTTIEKINDFLMEGPIDKFLGNKKFNDYIKSWKKQDAYEIQLSKGAIDISYHGKGDGIEDPYSTVMEELQLKFGNNYKITGNPKKGKIWLTPIMNW